MVLISTTTVPIICVFFKCKFSKIFLKNSTSCMLTKLITTICKIFFLTHKKNFRFLFQVLVKICNVETHTFWKSGQFDENTNSIGSRQCNVRYNFKKGIDYNNNKILVPQTYMANIIIFAQSDRWFTLGINFTPKILRKVILVRLYQTRS